MRIQTIILLSLFCCVLNMNAQIGSWVTKKDLNNDLMARQDAGMVNLNGKLYIMGGSSGCGAKDFTRYNPATGQIEKLKNVGAGCSNPINGGCLFAIAGKIYSVAGYGAKVYDTLQNTWTTLAALPAGLSPDAGFVINDTIFIASEIGNAFYAFNTGNNSFSQRANLPGQVVTGAIAFSINGKGYWGGGMVFNVGETSAFYEYDAANNAWTSKTGLPRTMAYGTAAVCNGKGYAGLGQYYVPGNSQKSQYWYEYDPIANSWASKKNLMNLPSGNFNNGITYAACATVGSDIFIFGGAYHGSYNLYIDEIYKYNAVTDSWTLVNGEPGGNRSEAAGFYHNGKIYIGGGMDSEPLRDLWEYNIATNQWTRKADFGSSYGQRASVEINGKGYFLGGYQLGSFYIDSLLEYNPANDVFTAKASFPGGSRGRMVALTYNGQLYAGMGTNSWGNNNMPDFYRYDPNTNTWASLASPPFAFGDGPNLKSFVIGDTAYVLTNSTDIHFYKYSFLSNSWSSSTLLQSTVNDFNSMDYCNQACTFNGKGYIITGSSTMGDCIAEYTPSTGTWKKIVNIPNIYGSRTVIPTPSGIYLGFGDAEASNELGVRRTNKWSELIFNAPISAQTGIYNHVWQNGNTIICGTGQLDPGMANSVYDSAGYLFASIIANTTSNSSCIEVNSLDTSLQYRERCGRFGLAVNESGMFLNKSVLSIQGVPATAKLRLYYTTAELTRFVNSFNTKYNSNKTIDSIKILLYNESGATDFDPLNNNVPGYHTIFSPAFVDYQNGKYVDLTSNGGLGGELYAVLTAPAPTATITGPSSVCNGSNITLTASGGGTYSWSNSLGSNAAVSVAPTAATTYTVSVSLPNNLCTSTATKTITINALPTPSLTGANAICNGASTTLTAGGGVRYAWSSSADTIATQTVSPATTTTYTVTVTNANNCSATATKTLTVNSVTAAINGPTSICTGTSAQLTASGGTYSWSNGLGTNAQVTVTPSVPTTYTVTVTNSSCTATASQTVQVSANPTASITGNISVCAGSSTTLTANGGNTYTWANGLGNSADITVSPTTATTYTVTVSLGANCTATASQTVSIKQATAGQIARAICLGTSFNFNGQTLTQGGIYIDTLVNAAGCDSILTLNLTTNTPATGSIVQSICQGDAYTFNGQTLTQGGAYTDTLVATNTCDSIVTLTLTTVALPQPTIAQSGNTLSTQAFSSYQWLLNDAPINGATQQNYTATQSGNYAVIATNSSNCSDTSNVINLTGVGIKHIESSDFALGIYPNPATTDLIVEASEMIESLCITDITGKVVITNMQLKGIKIKTDISMLANATYFIQVKTASGTTTTKRIVKQ